MTIRLYKGWNGWKRGCKREWNERFFARRVANRRISMNSLSDLQADEIIGIARDEKWRSALLRALPNEVLQTATLAKLQRAVQERISLLPASAIMLPRKPASRLSSHRSA